MAAKTGSARVAAQSDVPARIARPELTAQISDALAAGGVALVAGGGYGKTTALEQALEAFRGPVAWIRCSEADADPGRLLEQLMTALTSAVPGVADSLRERLAQVRDPVAPEAVSAELSADLGALLVEPLAVVFDDAEYLADAPAAVSILADLLAAGGSSVLVAVATRRRLPGDLTGVRELGPRELAFTPDECGAALDSLEGGRSPGAVVERLMAQTGGWPLGVMLARGSDQGGLMPERRRVVFDFFADRVLGVLDPELRTAAIEVSVAPRLDTDLVECLGGGFAALDRLREQGVVVGSEGGHGDPVAYHPVFREFLLERFAEEVPADRRRALWGRLAGAFERRQDGPAALSAWLDAENWERASGSLLSVGPALSLTAPATVLAALRRLPAGFRARPAVQMLEARLELGAGRFEYAARLSREAVRGFVAEGAPEAVVWGSRFALADALVAIGELEELAGLADGFEGTRLEAGLGAPATAVAAAAGLARLGSFDEAEALAGRAFEHPAGDLLAPSAPAFRGYYLDLPAGRLDSALKNVDAGIAALERDDPFGRLPYVEMFRLGILDERGEHEAALGAAARVQRAAHESGLVGWVGAGLRIRLAGMHARAGELAEAERLIADLADVWASWGEWEIAGVRAAIAGRRGDAPACLEAAERALASVRRWPANERLRTATELVPVLAASGHGARARSALERELGQAPRTVSTARARAVHGWLLFEQGDEDRAIEAVVAAWREAGDQVRHLVRREWPRLESLLWVALEQGAIDAASVIDAAEGGCADSGFVIRLSDHPRIEVRRAALPAMFGAGDPQVMRRLDELADDTDPGVAAAAVVARGRLNETPPPLAIRTLGGFELRRGMWVANESAWQRRIAQRLVRLLLCRRGSAVPEDDLFEAFWPDRSTAAARRNLQVAVSSARAVLDLPGTPESRLQVGERAYTLSLRDGDWVDVDEFEHAAQRALDAVGVERLGALQEAARLWRGEPLPEERYSDWAASWRERLIDLYGRVLGGLAEACSAAGDHAGAVDAARRAVSLDALDEAAQRRLILAYARSGRRGHALRQYLACRRALVDELGVEPAAETAALQRRVLAGDEV